LENIAEKIEAGIRASLEGNKEVFVGRKFLSKRGVEKLQVGRADPIYFTPFISLIDDHLCS
jgi:hypothetical protein